MSFARCLLSVISLVPVFLLGLRSLCDYSAGNKLTFGKGTRVLVKPGECLGLNHSSVSKLERGAQSSGFKRSIIGWLKLICIKLGFKFFSISLT